MLKSALFILWLIYLIFPNDLIPDRIPYLGRIDDLLLLAWLYWNFFRKDGKYNRGPSDSKRRERRESGEGDGSRRHEQTADRAADGYAGRDPYAVLGVKHTATREEIKRAYREQANRYHPDKVSHLGEEFQAMAKTKFQEIQWAYEKLAAERDSS